MEENPILSRGGMANQELTDKMRAENSELQKHIPEGCLHCSTAWTQAIRGRTKGKLQHCTGRAVIEVGGIAVMTCGINEPQEQMISQLSPELNEPMGENLGENLSRPAARDANRRVRAEPGDNTYADLGELGEHNVKDLRFRDSAIQGFLTAYVRTREGTRKKASEHKVVTTIVVSTVAIGLVTGSVKHLKHRKK